MDLSKNPYDHIPSLFSKIASDDQIVKKVQNYIKIELEKKENARGYHPLPKDIESLIKVKTPYKKANIM